MGAFIAYFLTLSCLSNASKHLALDEFGGDSLNFSFNFIFTSVPLFTKKMNERIAFSQFFELCLDRFLLRAAEVMALTLTEELDKWLRKKLHGGCPFQMRPSARQC